MLLQKVLIQTQAAQRLQTELQQCHYPRHSQLSIFEQNQLQVALNKSQSEKAAAAAAAAAST